MVGSRTSRDYAPRWPSRWPCQSGEDTEIAVGFLQVGSSLMAWRKAVSALVERAGSEEATAQLLEVDRAVRHCQRRSGCCHWQRRRVNSAWRSSRPASPGDGGEEGEGGSRRLQSPLQGSHAVRDWSGVIVAGGSVTVLVWCNRCHWAEILGEDSMVVERIRFQYSRDPTDCRECRHCKMIKFP